MRSRTRVPEAIASVIFGAILWLGQWLILRQTEITLRIFALINTVVGIFVFSVLVWLNQKSLECSGGQIRGWKTGLIFLVGLRQNRGLKRGIILSQNSFHVKVTSDERDNSRRHAPML